MTEEELNKILGGGELFRTIDVKSLVLDLWNKHSTNEEILEFFMKKLPNLEEAYVKRFLYMKRK